MAPELLLPLTEQTAGASPPNSHLVICWQLTLWIELRYNQSQAPANISPLHYCTWADTGHSALASYFWRKGQTDIPVASITYLHYPIDGYQCPYIRTLNSSGIEWMTSEANVLNDQRLCDQLIILFNLSESMSHLSQSMAINTSINKKDIYLKAGHKTT